MKQVTWVILKFGCQHLSHKIIPETMSASLGPTVWMFPMTTATTLGTDVNSTKHRSQKTGRILQKLFSIDFWSAIHCPHFVNDTTVEFFFSLCKNSILVSGRTFWAVAAERPRMIWSSKLSSVLDDCKCSFSFPFLELFLASSSSDVFFSQSIRFAFVIACA